MILKSKESAGVVERMKEMLGVGKKHANMSQFQPPWEAKMSLIYFIFSLRGGGKENWKTNGKKNSKRQDTSDPWDTRETLLVIIG